MGRQFFLEILSSNFNSLLLPSKQGPRQTYFNEILIICLSAISNTRVSDVRIFKKYSYILSPHSMLWRSLYSQNIYQPPKPFLMAFTKAHKFDPDIYHFSLMCGALSHPARVIILKRLMNLHGESANVAELTRDLPLSKQAISEHLKILREMSIVCCEEKTPFVYYSMNPELINTVMGLFMLVTQASLKLDEQYVEELKAVGIRRMIGTTPV